ncbi:IF4G [Enterospora canceri]|uniref:IF4G n=1 Tax=Enterospora canceri TaxID=1081671 RepID=A0A1Y1S894_9MICR|nr:IF4G [Enterospora canceri]
MAISSSTNSGAIHSQETKTKPKRRFVLKAVEDAAPETAVADGGPGSRETEAESRNEAKTKAVAPKHVRSSTTVETRRTVTKKENVVLRAVSELEQIVLLNTLENELNTFTFETVRDEIEAVVELNQTEEIGLNLIGRMRQSTMGEKLKTMKEKKHSQLELAKLQFNKVTLDKVPLFARELLALKLEKIEEVKELVGFVFGKVIVEKNFLETYTRLILILKKDFRCSEEKSLQREQTCFFGTLLKLMMRKIEEEHSFNRDVVVAQAGKTAAEAEAEIENAELNRKMKRNQALGSVAFCTTLYTNNVTGSSNIKKVAEVLMRMKSSETVEMLCEMLVHGGVQLSKAQPKLFGSICDFVKRNDTFGPRLEIIVEKTLERMNQHIAASKKAASSGNVYAGMFDSVEEKLENKQISESQRINNFFDERLLPVLVVCHDEYDLEEASDIVVAEIANYKKDAFTTDYFVTAISSTKYFRKMVDLYQHYLVGVLEECLYDNLEQIKENLPTYYVDYACSKTLYPELLCYLAGINQVTRKEFMKLQVPGYETRIRELVVDWKKSGDERLGVVFDESEIDRILKE